LFQLGIVVGIFIAYFINRHIQGLGDEAWNIGAGWRWMLAVEALPAFAFIALLFPIPESPKWLIQAGREQEARRTLERVGGPAYADAEVAAVNEVLAQEEGTFAELFSRDYRRPLIIAVFIMLASQFSGINVVIYYSTDIFKAATGSSDAAFTSSVWIGLVNVLATFIAILFVDKAGRKPLLLIGNAIQVIGLVTVGTSTRSTRIPRCSWGRDHLHGGFRDGDGADPVDPLLGGLPGQAARPRHVGVDLRDLDGLLPGVADLPHSPEELRLDQDVLLLRRLLRGHLPVRAPGDPGNQGRSLEEIEQSWHRHH